MFSESILDIFLTLTTVMVCVIRTKRNEKIKRKVNCKFPRLKNKKENRTIFFYYLSYFFCKV